MADLELYKSSRVIPTHQANTRKSKMARLHVVTKWAGHIAGYVKNRTGKYMEADKHTPIFEFGRVRYGKGVLRGETREFHCVPADAPITVQSAVDGQKNGIRVTLDFINEKWVVTNQEVVHPKLNPAPAGFVKKKIAAKKKRLAEGRRTLTQQMEIDRQKRLIMADAKQVNRAIKMVKSIMNYVGLKTLTVKVED